MKKIKKVIAAEKQRSSKRGPKSWAVKKLIT
jgi:hypothetical protein